MFTTDKEVILKKLCSDNFTIRNVVKMTILIAGSNKVSWEISNSELPFKKDVRKVSGKININDIIGLLRFSSADFSP